MDHPNVTTAFVAVTTPVVLRIMPLLGSPAPIGYIYDPTPARDGDGGCWRLPLLSLPIKGIKSSLTHARTSQPIAGLGGLRSPSSTWTGYFVHGPRPPRVFVVRFFGRGRPWHILHGGVPSCACTRRSPRFGLPFPYGG